MVDFARSLRTRDTIVALCDELDYVTSGSGRKPSSPVNIFLMSAVLLSKEVFFFSFKGTNYVSSSTAYDGLFHDLIVFWEIVLM